MENDKLIKASDVKEYFKRVIFGADQEIDTWVDSIPAVDAVEVVRCRECEYCRKVDEFEHWCNGFCSPERLVRKDDFCSHGKAKE